MGDEINRKWEYKIEDCKHLLENDIDCDMLNEFGCDGWELVTVIIIYEQPWKVARFILKREIK